MGQKVHPYGFRLGYNKNWQSRWFSKKDYPAFVYEDHEVRTDELSDPIGRYIVRYRP